MKNVLIVGTNDIGSACAIRLYRSGFGICMVGQKNDPDLFNFRNFGSVLKNGSKVIEEIKALSFEEYLYLGGVSFDLSVNKFINFTIQNREIAIVSNDDVQRLNLQSFDYCIYCNEILRTGFEPKFNGVKISCDKELSSGSDYVVETAGTQIGRVKYPFLTLDNIVKADPSVISILSKDEGVFVSQKAPGEYVTENDKIATIGTSDIYLDSSGYILGIISSGLIVEKGSEVIRLSQVPLPQKPSIIPSESFSIAGGVLEAMLHYPSSLDLK